MNEKSTAAEVLRAFFILGITSFGGPIAHLGYFRREFVEKRAWLTTDEYAGLVSLCQFLPGPASSQVGFSIGLKRAGWLGGVAAWTGFTMPSAIAMFTVAHYVGEFQSSGIARGVLHGLQLAAIAVVAQAVWAMAGSLCTDTPRRALALLAAAILMLHPDTNGQLTVLAVGAIIGRLALADGPDRSKPPSPFERRIKLGAPVHGLALSCLALFSILLVVAFLAPGTGKLALFGAFYRAGALVFGGGHVVLPLLRDAIVVPGWVSPQIFLSGYGAAQAMPGPLFTVATFLGAANTAGPHGLQGAAIATGAIFLPGLLLVTGALPYWQFLHKRRAVAATMMGINAAVVGMLGAAFINLLTFTTVQSLWDFPIAAGALALLIYGRARPILVVLFCAAAGAVV
jgi:chromate transporter